MAPPELKSEHLKMIPEFNGEVPLLPDFISVAESLVTYFYDNTNPNNFQNYFLLNSLKNKIKGDAKLNLSSHTITKWADLKQALLNTYGDKRDCYTLTIELCNMRQQGNESAFAFHARIQSHINLHASYVATHEISGSEHVNTYIATLGLRTFLKGLKEPLGSLMRTKDPKSLNEALNVLTNDFQVDATSYQTFSQHKQSVQQYSPHNRNNMKQNNYQQNNYQQKSFQTQKYTQQNRFFTPNPQQQQKSQQNYQQQNYQQPYRPPQYNQQSQNVWSRPSGQNLPKPTPMSISVKNNKSALNNIEICNDSNQCPDLEYEQTQEEEQYNPEVDYHELSAEAPPDDENFRLMASEQNAEL